MNEIPVSSEPKKTEVDRASMLLLYSERNELDDYILLLQRPDKGKLANLWELPGGKQERGMTLHDSILLEVEQETGIKIPKGQLEYLTQRQGAGKIRRLHDENRTLIATPYFYKASVDTLPQVTPSDEHQAAMWFQLNSLDYFIKDKEVPVSYFEKNKTQRAIFDRNSSIGMKLTDLTYNVLWRYIDAYWDDEPPPRRPVYPELWIP